MVEKLSKALEGLKNIQFSTSLDEVDISKKEKMFFCVLAADVMVSLKTQGLQNLPVVIENLINLCDDKDSDVRMVADESLNRVIMSLSQANMLKVQVELHRIIKKNGGARCVRAALMRFGQLSHFIRPNKGKEHVQMLIPAIIEITKREEESIHETLASSLENIMKVLGVFVQDNALRGLIKAFLHNLSSGNPVIRRCSASCIITILQYCRKPIIFNSYVLSSLLDCIVPICDDNSTDLILGVLGCLRMLLPVLVCMKNDEGISGSFGLRKRQDESLVSVDRLIQTYELCLHYTCSKDHNVVAAALETLNQILQNPPKMLESFFLSPTGFSRSYIQSSKESKLWSRSGSEMSVALSTMDESLLLDDNDVASEFSGFSDGQQLPLKQNPVKQKVATVFSDNDNTNGNPLMEKSFDKLRGSQSTLDVDSDAESVVSDSNTLKNFLMRIETKNKKIDDAETELSRSNSQDELYSPSGSDRLNSPNLIDVGTFTDAAVPLLYCARHIAASFLLEGAPNCLKSDRSVRVSVKSLALSCLSAVVKLHPVVMTLRLGKSQTETYVQGMSDILLYSDHSDPQIRGNVCILVGAFINSALKKSKNLVSDWLSCENLNLNSKNLIKILLKGLQDKSSVCVRHALTAFKFCVARGLFSVYNTQFLPLLKYLPAIGCHPYWLVKVKLVEVLSDLPYICISDLTGSEIFQNDVIDCVLMQLLGDEDTRVRKATAEALVRLIPVLHNGQSTVFEYGRTFSEYMNVFLKREKKSSIGQPSYLLCLPFSALSSDADEHVEYSLSIIVTKLTYSLLIPKNKWFLFGNLEALKLLSEKYPTTVYSKGWNCERHDPEESDPGLESSLIAVVMSLILTAPFELDLATFSSATRLLGNLFAGLSICYLKTSDELMSTSVIEEPLKLWNIFKSERISIMAEEILTHLLKVLNFYSRLLEEVTLSSVAESSAAGSFLPLLSPIKKQEKKPEGKTDEKRTRTQSTCKQSSQYVKLQQLLKNAYTNYKVSLDKAAREKFLDVLESTLFALSVLLEVATVREAGRCVEETLFYLLSAVSLRPSAAVICVIQLLRSLCGTNLASNWEKEKFSELKLQGAHLFDVFFHLPTEFLSEKIRRRANSNTLECETRSEQSRRAGRKVIMRNFDQNWLATHIRLFEPIIVKSLRLYTISGDVGLQASVLCLLSQIVQLRVNYCMLDEKLIFLDFVLKQFELIEHAQIPGVEVLLPCIFRFLVLLSYGRQHSKPIMSIPKILQLCDGLMASDQSVHTHCIPALAPVVEDIFFSRNLASSLEDKELETQREVLFSMLLRLSEFPEVMDMLSAVISESRALEGKERWKRWSRQVVESLLPLLNQDRLRIESAQGQHSFTRLMSCLSPNVLRPINPILKALFVEPSDQNCPTSLKRWLSKVTVLLEAVLFVKEDAILNRVSESRPTINLTTLLPSSALVLVDPFNVSSVFQSFEPSEIVARFILKVISIVVTTIGDVSASSASTEHLQDKLSMFFICVFHILKSGTFHKITSSLQDVLARERDFLSRICSVFQDLVHFSPVLTCQFSYFLTLLNYCDLSYWTEILCSPVTLSAKLVQSCGVIVLCDHLCDDVSDTGTFHFLIKNCLEELVALSHEIPVKEVFVTMRERNTLWGLLLEAVSRRNFEAFPPRYAERLLRLLEASEGSHSGLVLRIMAEKFLGSSRLALSLLAGSIACRQAEHLLTLPKEKVIEQIDRQKFRTLISLIGYSKRHSTLWSLLEKLNAEVFESFTDKTNPADAIKSDDVKNLLPAEDWYFAQVKRMCCQERSVGDEVPLLLSKLNDEKISEIMSSPDFNLKVLKDCLSHAAAMKQKSQTKDRDGKNYVAKGCLYKASKCCLLRKVSELCEESRKGKNEEEDFGTADNICLKEGLLEQFWEVSHCLISYLEITYENYSEVESEWVEKITHFGVLCLKALEWEISTKEKDNKPIYPKHLEVGLTCCGAVLKSRQVCSLLSTKRSLAAYLDALVFVVFHLVPHCRLNRILRERDLATGSELDRLEFLLEFIGNGGENTLMPKFLMASLRDIVVYLCRVPAISGRILAVPESSDIQDIALLKSFITRVSLVGWSSRQQFEEIWVALLSVLGFNTQGDIPVEENDIVVQASAVAVEGITALLESTMLKCGGKRLIHHGRDSLSIKSVYEKVPVIGVAFEKNEARERAFQFLDNLELCHTDERYVHGLMSVEYLWTAVKQISSEIELYKRHCEELNAVGLDLPSCIYLLTELYNQWIYQAFPDIKIIISALKSSIVISDLFTDISQFQWLLNFCLHIDEVVIPEDTVVLPLVILGCCKAVAIVLPNEEVCEKVKKLVLRSKSLPCRLSAVEGLLYLLQSYTVCYAVNHTTLPPPGSAFLVDEANFVGKVVDTFLPVALGIIQEFRLDKGSRTGDFDRCHWSLIFYVLQHYHSSLGDLKEELLNLIVVTLCSKNCPDSIIALLVRGMQRLLLTTMIDENFREQLGRVSVEIISHHSLTIARHGLQLLTVLSFLDKRVKDIRQLVTGQDDPERVMRNMEKINVLFEKLKKSYPKEAEIVGGVIAYVVEDFSASDVLTKVIQEFLFPHQPHQRVIAGLLFKVFERAEQSLLEDWVVFSLPGLVQGLPVPMSVWTLNCFFVSASSHPWLRFMFPLVQARVRKADMEDRRLLCISAARFYNQLKEDVQKKSFAQTFDKAKAIDSVFLDLLSTIS